jgi:hypothetical protein
MMSYTAGGGSIAWVCDSASLLLLLLLLLLLAPLLQACTLLCEPAQSVECQQHAWQVIE